MTNAEKLAIKSQINILKETIKNLESLLVETTEVTETKAASKSSTKDDYVIIKSMTSEEMTALANALIIKSGIEYSGKATKIEIGYAKIYNEGFNKPYLNRNKLELTIYKEDEVITGGIFNKSKFAEFFPQLAYLGVFQYNKDHTANVAVLDC